MHRLSKLGFTQSYNLLHLAQHQGGAGRIFHRAIAGPHAGIFPAERLPNTPDILHAALQHGGRPVCSSRAVALSRDAVAANYGIYGPAYELMEAARRAEARQ